MAIKKGVPGDVIHLANIKKLMEILIFSVEQFVDKVAVFLLHHRALHLYRGRENAVRRRPAVFYEAIAFYFLSVAEERVDTFYLVC